MALRESALRSVVAAVLSSALALALVSCGGGGGAPPLQDAGSISTVGPLQFQAFVPQTTYARGQQVPIYMVVTNTGEATVTVIGGGCEVLVTVSQNGKVVPPEPVVCGQGAFTYTFLYDNPQVIEEAWDGKLANGSPAMDGTYQLAMAIQAPASEVVPAAPASVTLGAPPITIRVR